MHRSTSPRGSAFRPESLRPGTGSGLHGPRGWGLEVEDVRISGGVTHAWVIETKDVCSARGELPSCPDPHPVPMASVAGPTGHQHDPEIRGLLGRDRDDPSELLPGRDPQRHVDDVIDRRVVRPIDRRPACSRPSPDPIERGLTHVVEQSSMRREVTTDGKPRPIPGVPALDLRQRQLDAAGLQSRASFSTSRRIRGLITTSWIRGGMGSARSTASGSSWASM